MIIVSACLCGINSRYDGDSNTNEKVFTLFKEGKAIPVCPEQLGGMCTPRPAHEIYKSTGKDVLEGRARVIGKDGGDGTEYFIRGAYETLKIAKQCGAKIAILKAKSPSCGYGKIYDGSFTGNKIDGNGVAAELLELNGIKIYTENDIGTELLNLIYSA